MRGRRWLQLNAYNFKFLYVEKGEEIICDKLLCATIAYRHESCTMLTSHARVNIMVYLCFFSITSFYVQDITQVFDQD